MTINDSIIVEQHALYEPIKRFIHSLKVERRLSPHTQQSYQRHLLALATQVQILGLTNWLALDTAGVRQLAIQGKRSGLKAVSLSQRFSILRCFFAYLIQCDEASVNPVQGFSIPRTAKALPKNLDIDQVNHLLTLQPEDRLAVRDRAIMELLYSSGLRLAELVALDSAQLDVAEGEVRVMGKGRKTRQVPVGQIALQCLHRWLAIRAMLPLQDDALFVSTQGRRLSGRNIQKRLAQWGVKQGVQGRVHPHKLRHAFATHMLEASGDLRAVQELLGHANLSSTQIYTHLNFQHLAAVYDASHPRAKRHKSLT